MSMKHRSAAAALAISALAVAGLTVPAAASADTQASYYVDPVAGNDANNGLATTSAFKTIDHARDVVRTVNTDMSGDIHVYLRGGVYTLDSTLKFTDADSGSNGHDVIYSAYEDERPELSGGMNVTGWQISDAAKGIYRAPVPAGTDTRQLYVNGERETRARSAGGVTGLKFISVKSGTYEVGTGYTGAGHIKVAGVDAPMDAWGNPGGIEFIYNKIWTAPRSPVESISYDGTNTTVTMKDPGWSYITNRGVTSIGAADSPWYIENAYELLDQPGEWYLDKSTSYVYYKPKADQNLATSQVVVPRLEELVRVQGSDADHQAKNIAFQGITFEHAGWLRPNTMGQSDAQNNVIREGNVPPKNIVGAGEQLVGAAVNLKFASSVDFTGNRFEHNGANALNMYAGSQDNTVIGNRFTDLSASAVAVGDYLGYSDPNSENYAATTDDRLTLRGNTVNDNYIGDFGLEYFSSSGLSATFPRDMTISHNEISGGPYTGMHIGWGWGVYPGIVSNTVISNNYIHELNTKLRDGGAIYTNGATSASAEHPATKITGNYLQNVYSTVGYAMYNDEAGGQGTFHTWDRNVVNNATKWAFQWRNTGNVYANTFTNVTAKGIDANQTETGTVYVNGQDWPTAARAIMADAGLEDAYADLKPKPVPADQRFAEDFDDQKPGAVPAGWTVTGADKTVQVTDSPSTANRSLKISQSATSPKDAATASQWFTPITSGTYSVRVKAAQDSTFVNAVALKSGMSTPIDVRFGPNGKIQYNLNGEYTTVQRYKANKWYDLAVTFDAHTRTYDIAVDGVVKVKDAPMNGTPTQFDGFALGMYRQSVGTAYIDDITVTEGALRLAETFEQDEVGSPAPGWVSNDAGGTATVVAQEAPESKALELNKTNKAGVLVVARDLTPITKGSVELRAMSAQLNAVTQPLILQGNGTNIELSLHSNGYIAYKNTQAAWVNVQRYTANTWYTLKVDFDTDADTYDLWIDGKKVASDLPFASSGGAVTQLKQYIYSNYLGVMRIDDVTVTAG